MKSNFAPQLTPMIMKKLLRQAFNYFNAARGYVLSVPAGRRDKSRALQCRRTPLKHGVPALAGENMRITRGVKLSFEGGACDRFRLKPGLHATSCIDEGRRQRERRVRNLPRLGLLVGLVLLAGLPAASAATASPPDLMSYQGYLVDVNGAALAPSAPANYPIEFRIYDASSGGNVLWGEQQVVTVDKGNFSVVLGEGTAIAGTSRPALSCRACSLGPTLRSVTSASPLRSTARP
jgi:hypothetical protein